MSPEEAAAIVLDSRLCLALYTASRSMTARYRVALEDFGLTYPQYLVMVLLWEEPSVPVGRIGERLSRATRHEIDRHADLLPVLRNRDLQVRAAMDRAFPHTVRSRGRRLPAPAAHGLRPRRWAMLWASRTKAAG